MKRHDGSASVMRQGESLLSLEDLQGLLRMTSIAATRKLVARDLVLSQAVVKVGRRVRLDPQRVSEWLESLRRRGLRPGL